MAELSDNKKAEFLELMASLDPAYSIESAALHIGVSSRTIRRHRAEDEEFAKGMIQAEFDRAEQLESVAFDRAKKGSDLLTIFLLKGAKPEKYRDNHKIDLTGRLDVNAMTAEDIAAEFAALGIALPGMAGDADDLA
jgi:hypothetical protein